MWVKECHKLLTGNGKHTTYQNGDDWGMVSDCLNHIRHIFSPFFFLANLYARSPGFNESEFARWVNLTDLTATATSLK